MSHAEYAIVMLLVLVRLFLVGIVIWFVVSETRKSGRTRETRR
jgi:hypothetical protein